jgi:cardiolipin synthase
MGDPAFLPTVEALTGAPVTRNNTVAVLLNGDEIFPAQLAAIRSAKTSITYAQYFYEDGPNAREIAEALAARCREGLTVHVLLDAFGTLTMPGEYRKTMEDSACRVVTFRPLRPFTMDKANNRNHRRILVIDGRIGFTGGSGASYKWMGNGRTDGQWRETDVRVEGPVVQHLQGAFAENWLESTGEVLGGDLYFPQLDAKGTARAQVVRSSPAGGSYSMYTMFILAVGAARRTIQITNPYFVPDDRLRQTLIEAAQRGVQVSILLPGKIDNNVVRQASRRELGGLLKEGIRIYEYQAGLLHSKTMVVDGIWSTVGSTNLDNRSFALNEELSIAVYSPEVARRFERIFADDLRHSRELDYIRWSQRSVKDRLLELLALPLWHQL